MAWKFLDASKPANRKYRDELTKNINSWWAHFQNKRKNIEAHLEERAHWDLEDFMADSLQVIDENLMWEFGLEADGGHHLVITPETERYLRPLVDTIIASAPKISGWHFYSYRQPHGYEETAQLVAETTRLMLENLTFTAEAGEENLIDLHFKYSEDKAPEVLGDAVFMACEYLLGEELLDRWIGDMNFTDSGKGKYLAMTELPNTVAKLIEKAKASMPDKPLAAIRDSLKVSEFTAEPEEGDDSTERFDMTSAKTRIPEIWQAAHGGSAFDSCRFSKHGEKFCYLKFDGLTDPKKIEAIEESVNKALIEANLGCTTGSAVGTGHGYVDLCLSDPDKAIPILRQTAQSGWLQFFDSDLSGEWVGLHTDGVTPPGMVEHQ